MNTQSSNTFPLSILDLVPVVKNSSASDSFTHSAELAQHAENLGYKRFWMSEHHNMEGVASSATVVLIGHIAGKTSKIRVGSGGIMLPNHAPLIVAEQFGTLETLYPGRIDLGLGRAPGTDPVTSMALRRDLKDSVEDFPRNVIELSQYFNPPFPSKVKAVPGIGLNIPIWILGSSTFGAQLAGMLGLPYAFASHFAPAMLHQALHAYRSNFQPSKTLQHPYLMAGVNVIAADTDEEAARLATSVQAFILNVIRGTSNPLAPPVGNMDNVWSEPERAAVMQMMQYSFVGSKDTVGRKLQQFINETQVDELMVVSNIFDHQARLYSYALLSHIQLKHAKPVLATA